MSLVIVTADGPEHRYVANTLVAAHGAAAILVCDPAPRRSWRALLRQGLGTVASKAARQIFLRAIGDRGRRAQSLRHVLGPPSEAFARPDLVRRVGRPRAGGLAEAVADLRPDILAVYGTSIVPEDVLSLAGRVALNMHTGLSPDYRGVNCAAWPIRDGRPEMVGATVHECTAAVDGGAIYDRAPARLQAGDDLHAIFARAVVTGAERYVSVVGDALAGPLTGVPQNLSLGREFRGAQIGIGSELATRRGLRRLQRQGRIGPGPTA